MYVCKSPVLRLCRVCDWFEKKGRKAYWVICGSELREYFDIPEEAREIRFFGYDKPSKNRVKVERAKRDGRNHVAGQLLIDGQWEFFVGDTDTIIESLVDKHGTLYVECEYA